MDRFVASRNAQKIGADPGTVIALTEDLEFYRATLHKINTMQQVAMSPSEEHGAKVLELEEAELVLPVVQRTNARSGERHAAFNTILELSEAQRELRTNSR